MHSFYFNSTKQIKHKKFTTSPSISKDLRVYFQNNIIYLKEFN